MKQFSWQGLAALLASLLVANGVQVQNQNVQHEHESRLTATNSNGGGGKENGWTVANIEAKYGAEFGVMVMQMLNGQGPGPSSMSKLIHNKMSIEDALSQLDGRLPTEVASLVRLSSDGKKNVQKATFDEDSLQKARVILNGMLLSAWKEMDDLIFESKMFQEKNRGTYEQVVGDISRLGSQLATLGEVRINANEGIMEQDRMRKEVESTIMLKSGEFEQRKLANDAEMTMKKNDLAVFDMILMMTACPADDGEDEDDAFMQFRHRGKRRARGNANKTHSVKLCQEKSGLTIRFDDLKLQAKVERMMTPDAKLALRSALGQAEEQAQLLQEFLQVRGKRQDPDEADNATTTGMPTFAPEITPVAEEPSPSGQARKCVDGTPNCGLLHDLMSLEWGRFRDSFDELATQMKHDQDLFDAEMSNMNEQLNGVNAIRTKHMEALAQTIAAISSDTEESNEKEEQKRELQEEHDKKMAEYQEAIEEILFTKICATRKVRNELMHDSDVSSADKITDCDFTDWEPRDGHCIGVTGDSISCDNSCPQADPYACGGLEWMHRQIVVAPNKYGMQCPAMQRQKKCNQIKCPVDCVESEWSGWSKCTKECEGGVKVRTRSILTKAKNGGKGCDTVQEGVGCNTGSCDRDCELDEWTDWTPCSMACGGGIVERKRVVALPIRGQGKCPTEKSPERFQEKGCNTHSCAGDEICIAKQDLVLMIDGSGSLKQSGFEIIRDFAAELTGRYASMYYGKEDMAVGVVLFGNGHLNAEPDGTTSIEDAIQVQGCTLDIPLVGQKITDMEWAKGFTNMAQGFQAADVLLSRTGRSDAQSAVLVLSDGKYSMAYQTAEKAQELKDKNILIFLAPITEIKTKELEVFRRFSSFPHETNYLRIPGLTALKFNRQLFAGQILAKFCPKAISPSFKAQKEEELQYMLVREQSYPNDACSNFTWHGKGFNIEDCRMQAINNDRLAFAFGHGDLMAGGCYTYGLPVTLANWDAWKLDRKNIACGGLADGWTGNPYFDFYVMKPSTMPQISAP